VLQPGLLRPGLAGDAVAVAVVLRMVARLAAVGGARFIARAAVQFGAAATCRNATVSGDRKRFSTAG
jgi:hypothetical protein